MDEWQAIPHKPMNDFSVCFQLPFSAMDISSDLTELGRTPVAVISAGVKSILDIPRTLEYLVQLSISLP